MWRLTWLGLLDPGEYSGVEASRCQKVLWFILFNKIVSACSPKIFMHHRANLGPRSSRAVKWRKVCVWSILAHTQFDWFGKQKQAGLVEKVGESVGTKEEGFSGNSPRANKPRTWWKIQESKFFTFCRNTFHHRVKLEELRRILLFLFCFRWNLQQP